MKMIYAILLISVLLVSGISGCKDSAECSKDSDCVPSQCCHASSCTQISDAYSKCKDMMCSQECVPGTMDCGQGSCACIEGKCGVKK